MSGENGNAEFVREDILDQECMRKMFVGGIPVAADDAELKTFFEECVPENKVVDHVVIRKETDKKSCFGFITFETSEMVDSVLLIRKDLNFKGRLLDVNRAVPKDNTSPGAHEKTKKLFIANLPKLNCSEEDIKAYFDARHNSEFGSVESVQLIKKKEGDVKTDENKGFGFVMVSSEDMADKMAIQHSTFEFGGRRIELKKSVPTESGGGGKRGGRGGGRGGYNAGQAGGYGGGYGGGYPAYGAYAGGWEGYGAGYGAAGYGAGYEGGYEGYGGGYGGGYGQQQRGGGRGGRGGARFTPY